MATTRILENDALAPLRDVPGLAGSFVVSDLGRLLARDMPAAIGDEVLGEVGPRALRLRDTLAYAGQQMDVAVLRYADYLLFLRPLADGVLCALGAPTINFATVKMALNLAARRFEATTRVPPPPPPAHLIAVGVARPPGPTPGRVRGY